MFFVSLEHLSTSCFLFRSHRWRKAGCIYRCFFLHRQTLRTLLKRPRLLCLLRATLMGDSINRCMCHFAFHSRQRCCPTAINPPLSLGGIYAIMTCCWRLWFQFRVHLCDAVVIMGFLWISDVGTNGIKSGIHEWMHTHTHTFHAPLSLSTFRKVNTPQVSGYTAGRQSVHPAETSCPCCVQVAALPPGASLHLCSLGSCFSFYRVVTEHLLFLLILWMCTDVSCLKTSADVVYLHRHTVRAINTLHK